MREDVIKKLVSGELKLHQADDGAASRREAVDERREAVARLTGVDLSNIGRYSYDPEVATRKNIENAIGAAQVPLGIAGPLKVNGEYARGAFYIPLATTEGALVASINRGCSVCTQSGGVTVAVMQDEMTRAPVVKAKTLKEAKRLADAVKTPELFAEMKAAAGTTTRHGELLRVDPYVVGRSVFLRLAFDTKDAMGMNMVTIASDAVMRRLEKQFDVKLVALSSNMCTDKKPAAINVIEGRGRTTVAEVTVPRELVAQRLKATPEHMCDVHYR
ncbi:MAG TPA: 3-hydroxy-3-methylglutaryl-CoA reductase, partial [Methanocella sp.]|nr:3-hydroxy-3-methylglutaryl-CoA reductase [Methanocella sp.]